MTVADQLLWESQPDNIKAAARACLRDAIEEEVREELDRDLRNETYRVEELNLAIGEALEIFADWQPEIIESFLGEGARQKFERALGILRRVTE